MARQAKPAAEDTSAPVDEYAGVLVTQILVSLVRGRVGFLTGRGVIFGTVSTDLRPGRYELRPDTAKQRWDIVRPSVPAGLRFEVNLQGALPWTLSYPPTVALTVATGTLTEPKTWGEATDERGQPLDPLWLYEGMPPIPAPKGVDDFDEVHYDIDYRSVKGGLSKWLRVSYRDGTRREVDIDTITSTTPRLFEAKKDVLKVMDDYNALFILGTFPTVFFIITISPAAGAAGGRTPRYVATRRTVPRSKAPTTPTEEPPVGGTAAGGAARARPVNGTVNVGGGHEPGSANATNLNPIRAGSGGPSRGIPNHVKAGFEQIGEVFEAGSVTKIISNRLRYGDVRWTQAANGSAKVMAPGGRLSLNVWTSSPQEAQAIVNAFTKAGFKSVQALGTGTGTIIVGVW